VLFADDDEHGVRAPVGQVMVARVELDGAEVADKDCAVKWVIVCEILWHMAVLVQRTEDCYDQLAHPHGRLGKRVEDVRRTVFFVAFAHGIHKVGDLVVNHVDRGLLAHRIVLENHDRFVGIVGKRFFDDKGEGDVIAVVIAVADDKAVHARTHFNSARESREYHMEERVLVFRGQRVLFLQIRFHRAHVHELLNEGFVIGAVWHHDRHKDVHRVEIAYKSCVPAVTVTAFGFFIHFYPIPILKYECK